MIYCVGIWAKQNVIVLSIEIRTDITYTVFKVISTTHLQARGYLVLNFVA